MKKTALKFSGLALVASLLFTGCAPVSEDPNNNSEGVSSNLFEDDGCTHITVATSSEKINLIDALGEAFKESPEAKKLDQCVTVKPINVTSGDGTRYLSQSVSEWPLENEEYWPTLWSPASSIWVDRVALTAGEHVVAGSESFTHTPVVFAVPESMARALGYPGKELSLSDIEALISDPKGWGSVGKPLWGSFKISKTNPNTSTTGLSVILMQSYEASGKTADLTVEDVNNAEEFSRAFELGAIHYGDTTGKVLTRLAEEAKTGANGSSYVSAVAVEETSLINYNMGNPDSHTVAPGEVLVPPKEKLVAVYPSGGSMWSDNPITVIGANWVTDAKRTAGEAFKAFLATKPAQEILPEYGFRPIMDGIDLGKYFTAEYGVDPAQPTVSLPKPEASVVSAAIDQWEEIRKPSAVLELVDVSRSMNDPIGDGRSKLDGAIEGVQSTLSHFRKSDQVGIWAFTNNFNSDLGDVVAPVRDFQPMGSDQEKILEAVRDLKKAPMDGTPLYDAVSIAYKYMSERAEPGRINAIIILSDGEDAGSNKSLDSLLVELASDKESSDSAKVRIFPIAYGDGADMDTLKKIADSTGGQVFDARDASKIDAVFASVINNF